MKPIQTVGVIGLGSLGVLYATLFTKALGRERVLVLADSGRIARYREEGVWCNGELCDFHYVDAAARAEPVDLLLFAVKYGGLTDAIATCRHLVGPETTVISVLNGISSEQVLGEACRIARGYAAGRPARPPLWRRIPRWCYFTGAALAAAAVWLAINFLL